MDVTWIVVGIAILAAVLVVAWMLREPRRDRLRAGHPTIDVAQGARRQARRLAARDRCSAQSGPQDRRDQDRARAHRPG